MPSLTVPDRRSDSFRAWQETGPARVAGILSFLCVIVSNQSIERFQTPHIIFVFLVAFMLSVTSSFIGYHGFDRGNQGDHPGLSAAGDCQTYHFRK